MKTYSIMAKMTVDISRSVRASSLEEAVALSKKLTVPDFVRPAKTADETFNGYSDLEVYCVYKE